MKKTVTILIFFIISAAAFAVGGCDEADSALAEYFRTGDSSELYRAKTVVRKMLFETPGDRDTKIRMGIISAESITNCSCMDFAAEAESALRMLDDERISAVDNPFIMEKAWLAKAGIYTRLLMPDKASFYLQKASAEAPLHSLQPGIGYDICMPYYLDFGILSENGSSVLFLPFTGAGLRKSAFSSILSVSAGLKYFSSNQKLYLQWIHGITPDFSCFDYTLTESYGTGGAEWDFQGHVLSISASAGRMLYSQDTDYFIDPVSTSFTVFSLTENLSFELMLYNDGLNKASATVSASLKQIPENGHSSFRTDFSLPISFDFVFMEAGLLARLFYSNSFTTDSLNIGKKHFIYENAVLLSAGKTGSDYYRRYETAICLDSVIRFFAFMLPAPADRIYIGINGSAGFGYDRYDSRTDWLYSLGISAGFDLDDTTPFEIRFGFDEDGFLYTYMTIVNRISHSF